MAAANSVAPAGARINVPRVLIGGIAAGGVWSVWSVFVNVALVGGRYASAQAAGQLLAQPRYPAFLGVWIVTLFLAAFGLAWLYAASRATLGAGPATAMKLGILAGFFLGFPVNLSVAAWLPLSRYVPLWWMVDL